MRLAAILTASVMLSGCMASAQRDEAKPLSGVASLDLCADQMLLKLVDTKRIKAVSNEAELDDSFAASRAAALPRIRPTVEEIAALRPAIVLKSYGGGPLLDAQLAQLGIKVVQLDYAARLSDIPATINSAAEKLGAVDAGKATVVAFNAQLAGAQGGKDEVHPSLLYVTPGGVTTGPGSLIDDAITAAGYRNYSSKPGWYALPLEQLVEEKPDAALAAFFDKSAHDQDAWSSARHPVARKALSGVPTIMATGAKVSCGNWLIGDVVEEMAAKREIARKTPS